MHWFDVSVIVLLFLSTAYSVTRGLTKEIFSIVAFASAFILAHRYYSLISIRISGFISNSVVADLLSFGFIFFFSVLIISQVGKFVRNLLYHAKALSLIDRAAGGILGLAKGILIIAVIMIPIGLIPLAKREILFKAKFAPYILEISRELSKISFSDKSILKDIQSKIKLLDIQDQLKIGIKALQENIDSIKSGSKTSKDPVGKNDMRQNKNQNPSHDNITKEDKEKLKKIIDENDR